MASHSKIFIVLRYCTYQILTATIFLMFFFLCFSLLSKQWQKVWIRNNWNFQQLWTARCAWNRAINQSKKACFSSPNTPLSITSPIISTWSSWWSTDTQTKFIFFSPKYNMIHTCILILRKFPLLFCKMICRNWRLHPLSKIFINIGSTVTNHYTLSDRYS